MIFLKLHDGPTVIVIEPGNLDRLRQGKPLVTPDRSVMICYTPDMPYLENRVQEFIRDSMNEVSMNLDVSAFDAILAASLKREPVKR